MTTEKLKERKLKNALVPNFYDKIIGKTLKSIRVSLQISSTTVARILTVSKQQLYKYEAGVNKISAGNLAILSKALQIDINTFYKECFEPKPTHIEENVVIPKDYLIHLNKILNQYLKEKTIKKY